MKESTLNNKCGIVILNYNSYDLTCNLVKHIINYDTIGKIVLIDNNSNDDFSNFINEMSNDKIYYIKNKNNTGYAAGNNLGLKYLKDNNYDYAFIANPDVTFNYDTISNILKFLIEHKDYAVASSQRTQNNSKKTGQFWRIPTYTEALFESIFVGRKIQNILNRKYSNRICEKNKNSNYLDVDVVGGAFYGCNLNHLSKIGYLDENTFLWYEENILCYKIRKNKYKVALLMNCEYEHSHKKNSHGNKNHQIFLNSKKYYCYSILNINPVQKCLLRLFDSIGILENNIICKLFGEKQK